MVSLLTRTLSTDYRADVFSFATLFYLIGLVITWLAPFLIIYGSGKVWNPVTLVGPVQARVRFKNQLMMRTVIRDDGDFISFDTLYDFDNSLQDHIRVPTVKASEVDDDGDGTIDRLDLEVEEERGAEGVHRVELMLLFEYFLESQKFMMESLAYLNVVPDFPRSSVEVAGDLRLVQSEPLPHFLDNPLNASVFMGSPGLEMLDVLREYQNRSIRTEFKVTSSFTKMSTEEGRFTLKVTVNYPRQANIVVFNSPFASFKWAYIQYFYVALMFIFIISLVNKHVFSSRLVTSASVPGVM